ncbi:CND2 protein, partial [Galbula dea]|nr:CND2 protein [Galbula dea]
SPGARSLTGTGTPLLAECPTNDDERERKQRRRSKVTELQLGSANSLLGLGSPLPRQADAWLPTPLQWTNDQISEHYSTCIKLSTENKITTKNAFGLHLIDCLTDILKQKESELTDFKVAAGTLDASAKIYSMRVDAVHADTYRVLGGLGRDSQPGRGADDPEEEVCAAPQAVRRAQTKKKHTFKTIEKNLNNINVSEASQRHEVDPMFQKTAAAFEECSTVSFFLSWLQTHGCSSQLQFESEAVPLPSAEELLLPSSEPVKVVDFKSLLAQGVDNHPICSSLAGFLFTEWDAETHEQSVSALLEKFKRSDQVFDVNEEMDSDGEDCSPPMPEDDFGSGSPKSAVVEKTEELRENLTSGTINQSKGSDAVSFREGDVRTMSLHLSTKPGEYSYFSPRTLSLWAGPEHWRFRPRHKADNDSVKETKKRNVKKLFEINFEEDVDFDIHFCKPKEATTVTKPILERQNMKSITLPAAFNYDPANFLKLFLKPAVQIQRTSEPGSLLAHEDEIGDYDYNNPNDTSSFCPALQAADSDDDNDPVGFLGQTGDFNPPTQAEGQGPDCNGVNITTYGELDLIAEPQKVNRVAIEYAKTAKKMDMKRLKGSMWDILTEVEEKQVAAEEEEEEEAMVKGEKLLSGITRQLRDRLPSAMARDLSVPLAFACLLHLATEKNLSLEAMEDLSDVIVKQGD